MEKNIFSESVGIKSLTKSVLDSFGRIKGMDGALYHVYDLEKLYDDTDFTLLRDPSKYDVAHAVDNVTYRSSVLRRWALEAVYNSRRN